MWEASQTEAWNSHIACSCASCCSQDKSLQSSIISPWLETQLWCHHQHTACGWANTFWTLEAGTEPCRAVAINYYHMYVAVVQPLSMQKNAMCLLFHHCCCCCENMTELASGSTGLLHSLPLSHSSRWCWDGGQHSLVSILMAVDVTDMDVCKTALADISRDCSGNHIVINSCSLPYWMHHQLHI